MRTVHLVGSVALDTAEEVFQTVGTLLKPHIKRCPDGEVGGRRLWISWQWPLLRAAQFLEVAEGLSIPGLGLGTLKLKSGVTAADIHFGELGYAREARASYLDFRNAREAGLFDASTRFQVSLPTPAAVVGAFILPQDVPLIVEKYEKAMALEVGRLCKSIPHHDLALQWDVCFEMLQWDDRLPHMRAPAGVEQQFAQRFARLSGLVPPGVQLGFHLCYGDMDGKHGIEPENLQKAAELANLLVSSAARPVNYIHMPVPIDRDDDGYFMPLANLRFPRETELILGLVHSSDGLEGALRRMRAASKHAAGFGIATECGMGRARTADTVRNLLAIHAAAAEGFSQ